MTKAGLNQPIGEAAINQVPRQMIANEVQKAMTQYGYDTGVYIEISAPGGEAIAQRTFNPRLGIVGGISILGTSGIVRPMSEAALVDSMYLEIDMLHAAGVRHLLLTPGNYGADFAKNHLGLSLSRQVSCSNYLGRALDYAVGRGMESVLLVGNLGKLVKGAAGAMDTHSSMVDGRRETMTAHGAICGGSPALIASLFSAVTTDESLALLTEEGLTEAVMASITRALDEVLKRRAGASMAVEAVVFSNQFGLLSTTPGAQALLELHTTSTEESP